MKTLCRRTSAISWKKWFIGFLAMSVGVIVCGILGLIVGALIGGNYAQDFTFLGVRGYEAVGLLGLMVGSIGGGVLSLVLTFSVVNGDIYVLTGVCLLVISAFLTLAVDQTVWLIRFYRVSASPTANVNNLSRLSLGNQVLIWAIITVVLLVLVFRYRRRLLPVSIVATLLFVALNLYSGRHLLPQLLIWPTPAALAEQYVQDLGSNDLEAALRLTNQSEACETIMARVFQKHQAQLSQKLGNDRSETSFQNISGKRITTFYEQPVPQRFVMMQPVPNHLVTIVAKMENGKTIWLNLKMRYTPFLGTRYICGQDMDD